MDDDTPRRRDTDRDRRRWSDERLDDLADMVRRLGADTGQLARLEAGLAGVGDDVKGFTDWLRDVETRLRTDLERERKEREKAEERQKSYTARVERSCTSLGEKLDKFSTQLSTVENEQDAQKRAYTRREKWTFVIATALLGSAMGIALRLLGLA